MQTKRQLRALTPEERTALEKLARSRTAETRLIERATLILALADGAQGPTIRELGRHLQGGGGGDYLLE